MTGDNNAAWQRYISAKQIAFDLPAYPVDATELKAITGREPRLLAKFDTPEQLPKPLRDAGYTLLPTQNGKYLIVRGSLFVELPMCATLHDFQYTLPFPLMTAIRNSGEAQFIDLAFNTGLLSEFLGLHPMYQTIRGRERTRPFEFQLSGLSISVDSVQIEVDSGYESLRDIALVEAKIGVPKYFNVRQMYFPYRHFSMLVPTKRIRNLFLAYDVASTAYHLYEYTFRSLTDPLSAKLQACGVYRLAQPEQSSIYDLIDVRFQAGIQIAPQADDLNKVFELLTLIDAGLNRARDVADYFLFDKRQSSYYREAAQYLGLVAPTKSEEYELTELGMLVLSQPPDKQRHILAIAVVNSWIFVELIQRASEKGVVTDTDIENIIVDVQASPGSRRYTGSTVKRRCRTITAWINWLAREFGCFSVSGDGYRLR